MNVKRYNKIVNQERPRPWSFYSLSFYTSPAKAPLPGLLLYPNYTPCRVSLLLIIKKLCPITDLQSFFTHTFFCAFL